MDAKDLAAQTRKALRAATKDSTDTLHGLTISVRTRGASMCTEIAITVTAGITHDDVLISEDQRHDGTPWTARARDISDRIHELAADAVAWSDGRMRFTFVYFLGGLTAPNPRASWEKTSETEEQDLAAAAADISDEHDAELEQRAADERADLAAEAAEETRTCEACDGTGTSGPNHLAPGGIGRCTDCHGGGVVWVGFLPHRDQVAAHLAALDPEPPAPIRDGCPPWCPRCGPDPDRRPRCPHGHGLMTARTVHGSPDESVVGDWFDCPTCPAVYVAPSPTFLTYLTGRAVTAVRDLMTRQAQPLDSPAARRARIRIVT